MMDFGDLCNRERYDKKQDFSIPTYQIIQQVLCLSSLKKSSPPLCIFSGWSLSCRLIPYTICNGVCISIESVVYSHRAKDAETIYRKSISASTFVGEMSHFARPWDTLL